MSYTSRHRYKSRRERYNRSRRHFQIIAVVAGIAVVILLLKNRVFIWDWMRTYFY